MQRVLLARLAELLQLDVTTRRLRRLVVSCSTFRTSQGDRDPRPALSPSPADSKYAADSTFLHRHVELLPHPRSSSHEDLGHDACADRLAALADGETHLLLERDRRDELDR